jgi:putative membrane protein
MFSGYCAGLGVAGWVLMVGLWGGFLAVVVWAVTRIFPSATRRDDAEDRLDRHVARDLDADAYRQMHDQAVSDGSR